MYSTLILVTISIILLYILDLSFFLDLWFDLINIRNHKKPLLFARVALHYMQHVLYYIQLNLHTLYYIQYENNSNKYKIQ